MYLIDPEYRLPHARRSPLAYVFDALKPKPASQWLLAHPEPLPLFDPLRWTVLLGGTLIRWAREKDKNMSVLVKALRQLKALGTNMKKHPKAMAILRKLMAKAPPRVAQAIEDFCLAEEAAVANRTTSE